MKISKSWIDYLLWIFLAFGWFGVARVSYQNFIGTPCPQVMAVPVCYLVLFGYTLMLLSVIVWHKGCRHYFFVTGWGLAAAIALVGSIAELISDGGGVCPVSGSSSGIRGASAEGMPLCYISLALLIVILVLFALGPYKRSCDVPGTPATR